PGALTCIKNSTAPPLESFHPQARMRDDLSQGRSPETLPQERTVQHPDTCGAMAYKTILAYLPDPRLASTVLDVAVPLAENHGAHLIGLHAKAFVEPYGVYGTIAAEIPPSVYRERQEDIDQRAASVREIFDAANTRSGMGIEWRQAESIRSGFSRAIAQHGVTADLIVTGVANLDKTFDPWINTPVNVVMEAGRPVLMVPEVGQFKTVGRRATIAWNETREAARAAFDAIPLLTSAESVKILSIDTGSLRRWTKPTPGEGLALCLARHDIKCDVEHVTVQNVGVGEEILGRADYDGADLLVMGCFGHNRLREYVFGGVTKYVMTHMSVPVLMSH
ncbi:MAG: universal stress protein, partial [Hyphomicrobiaceae bacterium]